ncbi:MAG: hypothetical protein IVW55_14105 [Chloroflexi bacterium]|nr:hypothetical protein [Chloroflexota bacterium]
MNKDKRQQSGEVSQDDPAQRFNGEDIEFEAFMFDAGEDAGVKPVEATSDNAELMRSESAPSSLDGSQAGESEAASVASPVTGEEVQVPAVPAYMQAGEAPQESNAPQTDGVAVRDSGALSHSLSTPLQGRLGRGVAGPMSTGPVGTALTNMSGPLSQRLGMADASSGGDAPSAEQPLTWSDSSLAGIEDFSAVLIAMRAGKNALDSVAPAADFAPAVDSQEQADERTMPDWAARAVSEMSPIASELSTKREEPGYLSGDVSETTVEYTPFIVEETALPQEAFDASELEPGVTPFEPLMAAEGQIAQEPATYEVPSAASASLSEVSLSGAGEEQTPVQGTHGFGGDDIEFESFMFDRGTSLDMASLPDAQVEEFMPAVAEMANAFAPDASGSVTGTTPDAPTEASAVPPMRLNPTVEGAGGELPFWLRDAAEVEVTPGEGYVEAASKATTAVEVPATVPTVIMERAPAFQQPAEQSFADLPPIEPFDFSLLGLEEIDDGLGFSTQELTGGLPMHHEPMMVTANLEALADVIGGGSISSPISGVLDFNAGRENEAATPVGQALAPQPAAPVVEESPAENSPNGGKHKTGKIEPSTVVDKTRKPGWTATVTSSLALDAVDRRTGSLSSADADRMTSTENLTVADLDVAPFDFTNIHLAEKENPADLPNPTDDASAATKGRGTKKLAPLAEAAAPQKQQEQLGEDFWDSNESDTSIFNRPTMHAEDAGDELPTGWLSAEDVQASRQRNEADSLSEPSVSAKEESRADATGQAEGIYKARVMNSGYGARSAFAARHSDDYQELDFREPQKENADMNSKTANDTERQTSGQAVRAMQPQQENEQPITFPSKLLSSGPLPELDSFVELQNIIEHNPNDVSAHMALAAAYTQAGDFDPALRVYRRILKQRNVSPTILQMIGDELAEFDPTLHGQSRFHQVMGDLYMKQGLYQEAIAEYNKIQ